MCRHSSRAALFDAIEDVCPRRVMRVFSLDGIYVERKFAHDMAKKVAPAATELNRELIVSYILSYPR